MRPNTPHFVVMPVSAICHGGHFYATSTIRDTIFGIYHMFVASRSITNTEHTRDAHLLLRRLVVYAHYVLVKHGKELNLTTAPPAHVPDVTTFEGTLDLFMLCVVMELGDLINPQAYKRKPRHDRDRDYDRLCTIHARGLARDLCKWWRAHYMFYDPRARKAVNGEAVFNDVFAQHISALLSYKKAAEERNIQGEELECTAVVLESLIKKYFPRALASHESPEGFEWLGPRYEVRVQPGVIASHTEPSKCTCLAELHPFTLKLKPVTSSPLAQLRLTRILCKNTLIFWSLMLTLQTLQMTPAT